MQIDLRFRDATRQLQEFPSLASPAISRVSTVTRSLSTGSARTDELNPNRHALRAARALPRGVLGPVLFPHWPDWPGLCVKSCGAVVTNVPGNHWLVVFDLR